VPRREQVVKNPPLTTTETVHERDDDDDENRNANRYGRRMRRAQARHEFLQFQSCL